MKGLPLAYNRDLQEDKEPLFDAVDQVSLALGAITGMVATATFDLDRMQAAADSPTSAATDLAEHLVAGGCRSARPTPSWARWCARRSSLAAAPLAELVAGHPALGPEAAALLGAGRRRAPADDARRRRSWAGGRAAAAASGAQLEQDAARLA